MLRLTLAVAFEDQNKFQLGELNDASECYEKILSRVHFHLTNAFSDDFCSFKHCITHQKFGMSLVEQTICECSATSEPFVFTQLVHYISTSAIIECSQDSKYKNDFSLLLRQASEQQVQVPACPQGCNGKATLVRTLITQPDVVSIGLVWNSESSELTHIQNLMACIKNEIFLNKLFNCSEMGSSRRELVGVVCYYMKHYSTFFKRTYDGLWISFDDGSVNEIGHEWKKVVDKVCKGRYQPLLLIFQNPDAKPLDISSAPRKNYLIKKNYENFDPYIKDSYMGPSKTLSLHNLMNVSNNHFGEKNSNNNNCSNVADHYKLKNEEKKCFSANFLNKNKMRENTFGGSDPCNHYHINSPLFTHPSQQYFTHPYNNTIPTFFNNLGNISDVDTGFKNLSQNAFEDIRFRSNNGTKTESTKIKNLTDFSSNLKRIIMKTEFQNDLNQNNMNNSINNSSHTAPKSTLVGEMSSKKLQQYPNTKESIKDACAREKEMLQKKQTGVCHMYPKPPEKFVFNPPLYLPQNIPLTKIQHTDFKWTNDKLKALQLKQKLLNIKIESNKLQQKVYEKRFSDSRSNESTLKKDTDVNPVEPILNYEHLFNCSQKFGKSFVCNFCLESSPFPPNQQNSLDNSSKISSAEQSQQNSHNNSSKISSVIPSRNTNLKSSVHPSSSVKLSRKNNPENLTDHSSFATSSQHANIDNYNKKSQSSLDSSTFQPSKCSLIDTKTTQVIPKIICNFSDQVPVTKDMNFKCVDICSNTVSFKKQIDFSAFNELKGKYLCQSLKRQFDPWYQEKNYDVCKSTNDVNETPDDVNKTTDDVNETTNDVIEPIDDVNETTDDINQTEIE